MSILREFTLNDLFKYSSLNLDPLIDTYSMTFYKKYLLNYPQYFQLLEAPNGEIIGYIIAKIESKNEKYHGHISALTISPDYRRLGFAAQLMENFENVCIRKHAYYMDLFVRKSNQAAQKLYEKNGYEKHCVVRQMYTNKDEIDEDGFELRKTLIKEFSP